MTTRLSIRAGLDYYFAEPADVPPPALELISPAEPTASPPGGSPARARDRPRVVRQEPAPQLVERPPTPTVRLHADLPAAGLSAQRGEGLGGLEGLGSGAGPGPGADSGAGGTTGGVKRCARGRWVRQPTLADVLEVWPRRAARELHTPAQVRISCVIRKDSRVKSCELLSETPPGWGFGAAAIRLARRSLFQPIVVDGRYTEIPVIVPFTFQREAKPPRSPASSDPAPRATASPPPS